MNKKEISVFAKDVLKELKYDGWQFKITSCDIGLCIYDLKIIEIPSWCLTSLRKAKEYVLHEIAHIGTKPVEGSYHNQRFYDVYGDLLKQFMCRSI